MLITMQHLDVLPFLPNQPTIFLERELDRAGHSPLLLANDRVAHEGVWYTPSKAVPLNLNGEPFEWFPDDYQHIKVGDYVRVPVWHYVTQDRYAHSLLTLGAAVMATLLTGLPQELEVQRLHLVVGSVYERPGEDRYDVYIGFAFHTAGR